MKCDTLSDLQEQLLFNELVTFEEDQVTGKGHFQSPLPLRGDAPERLGNNFQEANKANINMLRKLHKNNDDLLAVKQEFESLLSQKFIIPFHDLPLNVQEEIEGGGPQVFIPNSIAWKEKSHSTKTRLCFDASRQSPGCSALNSLLLKGSSNYNIVKTLVFFCLKKFAVASDASKYYNRLFLHPDHFRYSMMIWRRSMDPASNPQKFVMCRHFYGVKSSGALCLSAIQKIIKMAHDENLPLLAHHLSVGYVDDFPCSYDTQEDADFVFKTLPTFMESKGFPLKGVARSNECPPSTLTDNEFVSIGGYEWYPLLDVMKIEIPQVFIGKKKKGKYLPGTVILKKFPTKKEISDFYKNVKITFPHILSSTASFYDPVGFASPLKGYGAHVTRLALLDTKGHIDVHVSHEVKDMFLDYLFQRTQAGKLTFARNLKLYTDPSSATLMVYTDAGRDAGVVVMHLLYPKLSGKFYAEFLFSTNHLNALGSKIPNSELHALYKGVFHAEKLIEWLSPTVKNKCLLSDSQISLFWVLNRHKKSNPFVQNRVYSIARLFDDDEIFYIPGKSNPADAGTKFSHFHDIHLIVDESTLFRAGPKCMEDGVSKAVEKKSIIPMKDMLFEKTAKEEACKQQIKLEEEVLPATEIVKVGEVDTTVLAMIVQDGEEEIHDTANGLSRVHQRSKESMLEKVLKLEKFSNYLLSPLYKPYKTFFNTICLVFTVLRRWLNLPPSKSAPENWCNRQKTIKLKILPVFSDPQISLPDMSVEPSLELILKRRGNKIDNNKSTVPVTSDKDDCLRRNNAEINKLSDELILNCILSEKSEYLPHKSRLILDWISYPGVLAFIKIIRNLHHICMDKLLINQVRQKQIISMISTLCFKAKQFRNTQFAPISAGIVISVPMLLRNLPKSDLVNDLINEFHYLLNQLKSTLSVHVTNDTNWPSRKRYSICDVYYDKEELLYGRLCANNYIGKKTSSELEQFLTPSQLAKLGTKVNRIYVANTRVTFSNRDTGIFPAVPFLLHYLSPIAWSIATHIHFQDFKGPMEDRHFKHPNYKTLMLHSLKYGVILQSQKIFKRLELSCIRCLQRKKQHCLVRNGCLHKSLLSTEIVPYKYSQLDLVGPYKTQGVVLYGLVVICIQTKITSIYATDGKTTMSFVHPLQAHFTKYGCPFEIVCDFEGGLLKVLKSLGTFNEHVFKRFDILIKIVPSNAHHMMGLVERRIRFIHQLLCQYDFSDTQLSVTDLGHLFTTVSNIINRTPYGVKNFSTVPSAHIVNSLESPELLHLITPNDWTMLKSPEGISFALLQQQQLSLDDYKQMKLQKLLDFHSCQILPQMVSNWDGKRNIASNKLKINSIVMFKKRMLEPKNIPLKLARVISLEDSTDETQRVALIKYFNASELELKDGHLEGRGREIRQNVENLIPIDEAIDPPSIMAEEGDLREAIAGASRLLDSNSVTTSISNENGMDNVTNIRQDTSDTSYENDSKSEHCSKVIKDDSKSEHCSKVIKDDKVASAIKTVKRKNSDPDIHFNVSGLPKSSIVTRSGAKNL